MTEVVAALIWKENRFLICQRPKNKACALLWEFCRRKSGARRDAGGSPDSGMQGRA